MSQTLNDEKDRFNNAEKAFADLGTMIRQGRSFSGRERHGCFLNLGARRGMLGQFAAVSAIFGIDFPDDGRALAAVDWDDDGDLDLWISNRNAPRLRFLRNDTATENHHVSFKLQADAKSTNRDAIGARVEVVVGRASGPSRDGPEVRPAKSIKTLRAGEAYLSQSSKWLHFGLGDAEKIEKVVVRWPRAVGEDRAAASEEFTNIQADRRYLLVQGSGTASELPKSQRKINIEPGPPGTGNKQPTARIPLVARLPMPPVIYTRFSGEDQMTHVGQGKPLLVNLWASWCPPCVAELKEFTRRERDLCAAGVLVLALSVDGLGDDDSDPRTAKELIEQIAFPFTSGRARPELLEMLQAYHNLVIPLARPLPVPCSFLIDGEGRLAAIYKGPVGVEQLLADVRQPHGSRRERRLRAAAMPGSLIDDPRATAAAKSAEATTRFHLARTMREAGLLELALVNYRDAIQLREDFGQARLGLGKLLLRLGRAGEAAPHLKRAAELLPENPQPRALYDRVRKQLQRGGPLGSPPPRR